MVGLGLGGSMRLRWLNVLVERICVFCGYIFLDVCYIQLILGFVVPVISGVLVVGRRRHAPGAKALIFCRVERPKAETLGYLDANSLGCLDAEPLRRLDAERLVRGCNSLRHLDAEPLGILRCRVLGDT